MKEHTFTFSSMKCNGNKGIRHNKLMFYYLLLKRRRHSGLTVDSMTVEVMKLSCHDIFSAHEVDSSNAKKCGAYSIGKVSSI